MTPRTSCDRPSSDNGTPDDRRIGAEAGPPDAVAQHDDVVAEVRREQRAAKRGANAEDREEVRGDRLPHQPDRAIGFRQRHDGRAMRRDIRERRAPGAHVLIVGPRHLALARADPRELVRRGKRRRLEDQRVDDAEDGGVAADRDRERRDRDGRESRIADDETPAVRGVLFQLRRDARQPPLPLDRGASIRQPPRASGGIAELACRLAAGLGLGEAVPHQVRDPHLEMEVELVANVGPDVGRRP